VTPAGAPALLRRVPVTALAQLHPAGGACAACHSDGPDRPGLTAPNKRESKRSHAGRRALWSVYGDTSSSHLEHWCEESIADKRTVVDSGTTMGQQMNTCETSSADTRNEGGMLHELAAADYPRVRALVAGLTYHLSIQAVIEGTVAGRIWVDDGLDPQATFILTPEGQYLAGASDNPSFQQALTDLLLTMPTVNVTYSPGSWESTFAALLTCKFARLFPPLLCLPALPSARLARAGAAGGMRWPRSIKRSSPGRIWCISTTCGSEPPPGQTLCAMALAFASFMAPLSCRTV
jgi:hypothetical protein